MLSVGAASAVEAGERRIYKLSAFRQRPPLEAPRAGKAKRFNSIFIPFAMLFVLICFLLRLETVN